LKVDEDWFVCLTEDSDGNIAGEMKKTSFRNRSNSNGKSNFAASFFCSNAAVGPRGAPVYRFKIAQNGASAEMVFDRCELAECSESERRTISTPITQEGAGWSIKLSDGTIVKFEKFKPKDSVK
jgi:hypothetical protein